MGIKYTTYFAPFPEHEQLRTLPPAARSAGVAVTRDPYREADDGIWLQTFSQHLSIAFDLAEELVTSVARVEHAIRNDIAEGLESDAREIGNSWEMLWSHLDDARALAVGRGRDASSYDRARETARDLSSGAADIEIGEWVDAGIKAYKRTVRYRIPRLESALNAMEALQAAVPEAQIARQPEPPDLRRRSRVPWKWFVIAVVVAAGVAVGTFEWNLLHSR